MLVTADPLYIYIYSIVAVKGQVHDSSHKLVVADDSSISLPSLLFVEPLVVPTIKLFYSKTCFVFPTVSPRTAVHRIEGHTLRSKEGS